MIHIVGGNPIVQNSHKVKRGFRLLPTYISHDKREGRDLHILSTFFICTMPSIKRIVRQ